VPNFFSFYQHRFTGMASPFVPEQSRKKSNPCFPYSEATS